VVAFLLARPTIGKVVGTDFPEGSAAVRMTKIMSRRGCRRRHGR
jgi:hypothetical protein